MKIPFMKAQGAGNDFIIVDKNVDFIRKSKKVIKRLCDRRFGVGCDQLILIKKISSYYQVTFYNSDGSLGKNCGNGLRCVYKFLVEVKKVKRIKIPGLIKIMGANIGNPHCVVLVKNLKLIKLNMLGPLLVKNKLFPDQANITFVEVLKKSKVKVLFWERGGGHTLACGSGTCATAFVLNHNDFVSSKIKVVTERSVLKTEIKDKMVFLQGPAELVYQSSINI